EARRALGRVADGAGLQRVAPPLDHARGEARIAGEDFVDERLVRRLLIGHALAVERLEVGHRRQLANELEARGSHGRGVVHHARTAVLRAGIGIARAGAAGARTAGTAGTTATRPARSAAEAVRITVRIGAGRERDRDAKRGELCGDSQNAT